jgi:hypothetical protein
MIFMAIRSFVRHKLNLNLVDEKK